MIFTPQSNLVETGPCVQKLSRERQRHTNTKCDHISLFIQAKNRKPMKYPKVTLKDEAWAGDRLFFISGINHRYFAVCPQHARGVQGNPLAPAVVSVI